MTPRDLRPVGQGRYQRSTPRAGDEGLVVAAVVLVPLLGLG